jgi:protein required for attachment to host cells
MNHITWVLVADTCKAKIFKTIKARLFNPDADGKDLTLVHEYTHPEGRKRDQDLVSDKSGAFGASNFTEATDPKRHENERFAAELTKALSLAHNENNYQDLILIAPPAFMGMINKNLAHEVKKLVCQSIEKDYTRYDTKELAKHLRDYL